MTNNRINLYSDTQTVPTAAMRQAIANAEVGDEQRGEDPSVNQLCEMVADLLGKEAAVFLPSGTMCNEIAIRVHCRPGEEIISDETSHIRNFEGGGPAAISGAMIWPVAGKQGIFSAAQLEQAIRPVSRYFPRSRLVVVEQTANMAGGTIWPLQTIHEVAELARKHSLTMHMDGARLLNAVVAASVSARDFCAPFDSAWIDLSKGLGCPVGAVLVGSQTFIDEVWWWKQRMGGALRQAGILAAAGIYALEHHVERMAEDHANARWFAGQVAEISGIEVNLASVQTNMVFFDVAATGLSASDISKKLEEQGILIGALEATRLRAVTHLDVNRDGMETAVKALREICSN